MKNKVITNDMGGSDLLEEAMSPKKITEKLDSHGSSDAVSSDTINLGSDADVLEESFGTGANRRVLLVTKGISLKKIVAASK